MIKKALSIFIVLAFLNLVIMPGFTFADSGYMIDEEGKTTILVGLLVVVAIVVVVALLATHAGKKKEQAKDQEHDTKMSTEINLDYQSPVPTLNKTNNNDQLVTPSGQLVLLSW